MILWPLLLRELNSKNSRAHQWPNGGLSGIAEGIASAWCVSGSHEALEYGELLPWALESFVVCGRILHQLIGGKHPIIHRIPTILLVVSRISQPLTVCWCILLLSVASRAPPEPTETRRCPQKFGARRGMMACGIWRLGQFRAVSVGRCSAYQISVEMSNSQM